MPQVSIPIDMNGFSTLNTIVECFNSLFLTSLNTRLEGGGEEPLYQPSIDESTPHRIVFTQDYIASALHEISHWCIAGEERRQHVDYGYWYAPDGRTDKQQQQFEHVEVKPQALEWMLSTACAQPFRLSADNLLAESGPSEAFRLAVFEQVHRHCHEGVSERVERIIDALAAIFNVDAPYCPKHYIFSELS